ncbi:Nascent polypeptide-associated complex subunit alpha-like protein 2 [Hibiscus syriacus]|uniref:Nascent polypeptide-associated complex subunit alpha-like protein 2 n=1 Tax=Hibiscus syriacus TaxID=106335 RepID=A0A6A3BA22_HIBSY|nr:Nascent polypeptide-associated complex subunit alpha-like protein 2 [Hibiscus syriacus]
MKRVEETDDCFILDFNPFNPVDVAKLSAVNDGDVDEELSVVAERGQETDSFKNREKFQIWHLIPVHALMILETRIRCAGFIVSVILQYDLQLHTLQLYKKSTGTPMKKSNTDLLLKFLEQPDLVACRDYPHSRHLCLQFPFDTTPHDKHCDLCYCYICDSAAPCECWTTHFHAAEHVADWRSQRLVKIRPRTL